MASKDELSDFLESVERRAYKRAFLHVRDENHAMDIVQESMMKLVEHYSQKPITEIPLLFQKILSNCILDWFRNQKKERQYFTNISEFDATDDAEQHAAHNILEMFLAKTGGTADSTLTQVERIQTLTLIEEELKKLTARQREAFLLRYWEEMDVPETAKIMGCSEGSVKTHCFRATTALCMALKNKGLSL